MKPTRPKSIYEMINMKGPVPYQSAGEIYEDVSSQQMSKSNPYLHDVLVGDVQADESSVILEQIQNAQTYSMQQSSSRKKKTVTRKSRVS